jgi:hypothetical protein
VERVGSQSSRASPGEAQGQCRVLFCPVPPPWIPSHDHRTRHYVRCQVVCCDKLTLPDSAARLRPWGLAKPTRSVTAVLRKQRCRLSWSDVQINRPLTPASAADPAPRRRPWPSEHPAGGEPHSQRCPPAIEQRARRHRRPLAAGRALVPAIGHGPAAMPALRAGEAARPPQPVQVVQAVGIGREP